MLGLSIAGLKPGDWPLHRHRISNGSRRSCKLAGDNLRSAFRARPTHTHHARRRPSGSQEAHSATGESLIKSSGPSNIGEGERACEGLLPERGCRSKWRDGSQQVFLGSPGENYPAGLFATVKVTGCPSDY